MYAPQLNVDHVYNSSQKIIPEKNVNTVKSQA